jgi:hypothetical protein
MTPTAIRALRAAALRNIAEQVWRDLGLTTSAQRRAHMLGLGRRSRRKPEATAVEPHGQPRAGGRS